MGRKQNNEEEEDEEMVKRTEKGGSRGRCKRRTFELARSIPGDEGPTGRRWWTMAPELDHDRRQGRVEKLPTEPVSVTNETSRACARRVDDEGVRRGARG